MIGAGQDPAFMSDRDLWKKRLSDQNYLSRVAFEVKRILTDDDELEMILGDNAMEFVKIRKATKGDPIAFDKKYQECVEKHAETLARIRIRPGDIDEE